MQRGVRPGRQARQASAYGLVVELSALSISSDSVFIACSVSSNCSPVIAVAAPAANQMAAVAARWLRLPSVAAPFSETARRIQMRQHGNHCLCDNCFRCPSFPAQRVKPDRRGLRRPQPETAVIIYAGIDGTSTETDTYERTYYNSFVNRLHRNELLPFDDTWYLRGPYLSGFDTDKRARACHLGTRLLEKQVKAIFLGGHSRGGAAVIEVASWLAEEQIPVECLVLSTPLTAPTRWAATSGTRPLHPPSSASSTRSAMLLTCSRLSFGNCGFRHQASTTFLHQKFFATHGGIGGVPWPRPCCRAPSCRTRPA